jgi:hypothetical protein
MWSKYTFVCDPDECDALVEFTARDGFGFPLGSVEMTCPCGRKLNYISYEDAWEPIIDTIEMLDSFKIQTGISIDSLDVMKITPREVVKINTNPYN